MERMRMNMEMRLELHNNRSNNSKNQYNKSSNRLSKQQRSLCTMILLRGSNFLSTQSHLKLRLKRLKLMLSHKLSLEELLILGKIQNNLKVNAFRNDVLDHMDAYIGRQFRKGTTQYGVYADQSTLRVEISCHNLNFKNYWGGEWLSSWTVDL